MTSWLRVFAFLTLPVAAASSCSDTGIESGSDAEGGAAGQGGNSAPSTMPSKGGAAAGESSVGQVVSGGNPPAAVGGEPMGSAGHSEDAGGAGQGGVGPEMPGLTCLVASPGTGGDGGNAGSPGQWLDVVSNECRQCPASELTCDDLLLQAGTGYDPMTREFTLVLPPGTTQVVRGELNYVHYSPSVDDYLTATTDALVSGNTLFFDLSGTVAEDLLYLTGNLTWLDGCGDEKSIGIQGKYLSLQLTEASGSAGGQPGVLYSLTCDL